MLRMVISVCWKQLRRREKGNLPTDSSFLAMNIDPSTPREDEEPKTGSEMVEERNGIRLRVEENFIPHPNHF